MTPVTPETFAKWKTTRMDKKKAEEELMKNAKASQAAAGKNTGMSGRDLVRLRFSLRPLSVVLIDFCPAVHFQSRMVRR